VFTHSPPVQDSISVSQPVPEISPHVSPVQNKYYLFGLKFVLHSSRELLRLTGAAYLKMRPLMLSY